MNKMNEWAGQKYGSSTKKYKCPYCENIVAANEFFRTEVWNTREDTANIWICPHCRNATIFIECRSHTSGSSTGYLLEKMIPNNKIGKDEIKNLPIDIKFLWNEIRDSYQANAFDGVSLLTRTLLLMLCENLDKSNTINKSSTYKDCVDYLIKNGYIPKNSAKYADELRTIANEFTHELQKVSEEQAKQLINIVEFLLVTIYEYGDLGTNPSH